MGTKVNRGLTKLKTKEKSFKDKKPSEVKLEKRALAEMRKEHVQRELKALEDLDLKEQLKGDKSHQNHKDSGKGLPEE
jgi:hypothetical protein